MKNLLHNIQIGMMLALFMAGIQSCTDESEEVGIAEVSFTATLPADVHARSFGKAEQINTLVVGVFDENETPIKQHFFPIRGTTVDISLALAQNQTYNFVFWAYDDTQNIYDIDDLSAIQMDALPASITFEKAEAMDAFFATQKNITITGDCSYPIELVRPLAQINIGTTGTVMQASFTAKAVPHTFYPFENSVSSETANYTWNFSETTTEKFSVEGTEYNYLAMGYVFAPTEVTKIAVELTLAEEGVRMNVNFPEVEIEANKKSNIAGRFTADKNNQ